MKKKMMFVICALVVLLMGTAAMADMAPLKTKGENNFICSPSMKKYGEVVSASVAFCNAYEKGKLRNIKIQVSNSSVLKFKVLSDTKIGGVLYPKKAGKATITYIADSGNRKIKEVYHINIIKFTNPFTSITYGGKDISGKIKDTYNEITVPKGKADSKIEYKLKPGWKVRYKNESSVEVANKKTGVYCSVDVVAK